MEMASEEFVWVRRQWNDRRDAKYRMEDLESPHWDTQSGGVNSIAPRPFLHAYVWCDEAIEGELAHCCAHGRGPHRIKVCITKKMNSLEAFRRLDDEARGA